MKFSLDNIWKMVVFKIALVEKVWIECMFKNVSSLSCMGHPYLREALHMYNFIFELISTERNNSIQFVPAENISHALETIASGQADFRGHKSRHCSNIMASIIAALYFIVPTVLSEIVTYQKLKCNFPF